MLTEGTEKLGEGIRDSWDDLPVALAPSSVNCLTFHFMCPL